MNPEPFAAPGVRGFLERPEHASGNALVLTHGAGSDANAPLLVAVASAFAAHAFLVLRCDLPFRQTRPHGSPFPAMAARDREGLRSTISALKALTDGPIFLGGHSYGGRQATIAASEDPGLVSGLLLLSYPLHPPRKPQELRTAHFPQLRTPSLFVHGSRDPFGSLEEMQAATALIAAPVRLFPVEGGSHDLIGRRKTAGELPAMIVNEFRRFTGR